MAAKKKRAPRALWLRVDKNGDFVGVETTRRAVADDKFAAPTDTVHGPYVLAERARER
jgi:hypothetical protein